MSDMKVTHRLLVDLTDGTVSDHVSVVQADKGSRKVALALFAGGRKWTIPDGTMARILYETPGGGEGDYDTLPDGSCAWSCDGNVVTVELAEQMMVSAGDVRVQVLLTQGESRLHTFIFYVEVQGAVNAEELEGYESSALPAGNQIVSHLTDAGRKKMPAIISFIDDDCRGEAYYTLYKDVIDPLGLPYMLACPPGDIGREGYVIKKDLLEMCKAGVEICCHHMHQHNMDAKVYYPTAADYEADLKACQEMFRAWGLAVNTISYPQGRYVDDYLRIVKKYYKMGFTVADGINQQPYESYYMKRVGLFEDDPNDDGSASLKMAKAYVDQVAASGGWLVFMTHAWYAGFSVEKLTELVTYIRGKGVEIVGVNEAIEATGNVIEVGRFRKPTDDFCDPFFVVDANGQAYVKSLQELDLPSDREVVELTLAAGKVINDNKPVSVSDQSFVVSQYIDVTGCEMVVITGWAYAHGEASSSGYQAYVFKDAAYNVLGNYTAQNSYDEGGDLLDHVEVAVPEGATMLMVAGNTYQAQPVVTKVYGMQSDLGNREDAELTLTTGKAINDNKPVTVSDPAYVVSQYVELPDNCKSVIITGWAYAHGDTATTGYQVYTIKDSAYKVLDSYTAQKSYDEGGDLLDHVEVPVPEGATMLMVAGNIYHAQPAVTMIYEAEMTDGCDSPQNVNPVAKTEDMTQPVGVDENGLLWTAPGTGGSDSGETGATETVVGTTPFDVTKEGLYIRPDADTVVYNNQDSTENLIDQFQTLLTYDNVNYGETTNSYIEVNSINDGATVALLAHIYGYAAEVGDYTLLVKSSTDTYVKVMKRTNSNNIAQVPATNIVQGYSNSVINFSVTEDDVASYICNLGIQITNTSASPPDTFTIQLVRGNYDAMPAGVALEFQVAAGRKFYLNAFNGLTAYSDPVTDVYEAVESESDGSSETTAGTALCFGDSLTAMTEYPERITQMGMNAVNFGVSASFMRYVAEDNELYPYCLCRIVDCMEAGDFSTQIAGGKNANYANLASLLNTADAFVLEYGTNDYNGDCKFEGEDTDSIEGALRYCLTKLFTLFPRKEIYVVSTFMYTYAYGHQPENPNGTVAEMNAVIERVCEEFAVPFIDLRRKSGFNQITRNELTGDGLHPTEEPGKEQMARFMYGQLRANGRV